MNKHFEVIVVGAGASGLMAAGRLAELGAKVLLTEKMPQPARKLRITGKGRCNLTNLVSMSEFIKHIGENGKKLRPVFSQFFSNDLIQFFEKLNVETVVERGERVFPKSEEAKEIVDSLLKWNKKNGVTLLCETEISNLIVKDNIIEGIKTVSGEIFLAKFVILATGGASYPATGSSGDGYKIAAAVGHKIISVLPALVPLETSDNIAEKLQGLSLKNVQVNVFHRNKKIAEQFGEMLFTHFGLSGPIILSLSRKIVNLIEKKEKIIFSIDLKPALDEKTLDQRLLREFSEHNKMKLKSILKNLLPASLIPVCAELCEISLEKFGFEITADQRRKLRIFLKDFRFEISGHRGFKEAIITQGGIDISEVNLETMESKKVKNLFFAGEILDFDADTGGYNLQIAFSTGFVAAESIFKMKN